MGKKSGPSAPPPPPPPPSQVYANQIGQWRNIEQDKLNRKAEVYNQQATTLNDQLDGYAGDAQSLYGQTLGLDINDDFNAMRDNVLSQQAMFNSQDLTLDRPEFQTQFQGINLYDTNTLLSNKRSTGTVGKGLRINPNFRNIHLAKTLPESIDYNSYQAHLNDGGNPDDLTPKGKYIDVAVALNNPHLVDGPDAYDTQRVNNLFGNSIRQLDTLERKYNQEMDRIGNFSDDMRDEMFRLGNQMNGFDINDMDRLGQLEQQIGFAQDDIGGFTSKLDTNFNRLNSGFGSLLDSAAQLRQDRADEINRVTGFEDMIMSNSADISNQVGGLDITNIDQMNQLRSQLDNLSGRMSGFNSNLDIMDLSQEQDALSGARGDLDALFGARQAEFDRVDDFEQRLLNQASSLSSLANSSGMYDLNNINNLSGFINDARTDIGEFESPFEGDFSSQMLQLSAAENSVNQLLNQRTQAMGDLTNTGNLLTNDIAGANAWDEQGLRALLAASQDGLNQSNQFIGDDTGDLSSLFQSNFDSANTRLNELFTERDTIEGDFASALEAARGTDFLDLDQLSGMEQQLADLQGRMSQYGAQQAQDEFGSLSSLLSGERSRLERDAANVAAQQAQAQQSVQGLMDSNGNLQFQDLSFRDPMTDQQYLQSLNNMGTDLEDDELQQLLASSFARNLGVIKA